MANVCRWLAGARVEERADQEKAWHVRQSGRDAAWRDMPGSGGLWRDMPERDVPESGARQRQGREDAIMRLVSIASASSGNCIYAGTENTHILIDAGISNQRIERGLNEIGVRGSELDAVFITHEHSDHVKGLGVLARRHGVPVYATQETLEKIGQMKYLGEYPRELLRPVRPDAEVVVGDMVVKPFRIDHDAADPVAYRIRGGRSCAAVATDMGHFDQYVIEHLQGLDAILVESNHDVRMLETGPYPYYLKRRILSDYGHLSNDNAGRLLNCILHDHLKYILLGHLSQQNNYEELAYETVRQEIDQGDHGYRAADFHISVAARERMSQIINI